MTNWSPEAHLDRALCPGPLLDTLGLQRREYWSELSPILKRWKSVNDSKCPDCGDQHGPPHPAETHNVYVFLAVPGAELFVAV